MKIAHADNELELHVDLRGPGPALLLLHGYRESSRDWDLAEIEWPGSVYRLDFAGHGESGWNHGGDYSPELLAADADAALAEIGSACVAGRGLGAYVALMLAGARPNAVPAALLLDGKGLAGGGPEPDFERELVLPEWLERPGDEHDPKLAMLEGWVHPPAYARALADAASAILLAQGGGERPPWWVAVSESPAAWVTVGGPASWRRLVEAGKGGTASR